MINVDNANPPRSPPSRSNFLRSGHNSLSWQVQPAHCPKPLLIPLVTNDTQMTSHNYKGSIAGLALGVGACSAAQRFKLHRCRRHPHWPKAVRSGEPSNRWNEHATNRSSGQPAAFGGRQSSLILLSHHSLAPFWLMRLAMGWEVVDSALLLSIIDRTGLALLWVRVCIHRLVLLYLRARGWLTGLIEDK